MKFVILGTTKMVISCAKALITEGAQISLMVSMPKNVRPNNSIDIANFANNNDIDYHECEDINSQKSIKLISRYSPDYIFVSWPKILKNEILKIPKYYSIGTHPTDLPYNRGRHPLHWLISLGILETKLSFFRIDKKIDNGKILLQIPISFTSRDIIDDLNKKINKTSYKGMKELYNILLSNPKYRGTNQKHSQSNYWRKKTPFDVMLDLRMSSESIIRTIRSFTLPYPCAKLIFENRTLKIINAYKTKENMKSEQMHRIEPGKIISIKKNIIKIKAEDDILNLVTSDKIPLNMKKGTYVHPPSKYISENQ